MRQLKNLGLRQDNCVYVKFNKGKFIFLILYVDDILLASNDVRLIQETKDILSPNLI
jgi:hypothetical protein